MILLFSYSLTLNNNKSPIANLKLFTFVILIYTATYLMVGINTYLCIRYISHY